MSEGNGTMSAELGALDRFCQQFLLADQSHVLPLQEPQLLQRPRANSFLALL
jgi:hypothetical protein